MRVAQDLAGVQARAAWNAGAGQDLHDVVLRALRRPRFHQGVDVVLALPACLGGVVAGVADEVAPPDGVEQGQPHLLRHEDEDVVVGPAGPAPIRRPRYTGAELIPGPRAGLPEALVIAQADPDEIDDRVLHGDLDLLAFAGRVALHERGEDPDHAVHPGARVSDGRPDVGRRAVREAGDAHRPAHRLRDRLLPLVVTVRPVRPEPLDARVHEARIELPDFAMAEAQTLEHAGAEVLQEHIGGPAPTNQHNPAARDPLLYRSAAPVSP